MQLTGQTTTTRILHAAGVTTIDALADLDLAGATAQRIRRNPDFTENLAVLQRKAQARRTMLPGGKHALVVLPTGTTQPAHEVEPLPTRPLSQLPAHDVPAPEPRCSTSHLLTLSFGCCHPCRFPSRGLRAALQRMRIDRLSPSTVGTLAALPQSHSALYGCPLWMGHWSIVVAHRRPFLAHGPQSSGMEPDSRGPTSSSRRRPSLRPTRRAGVPQS